MRRLLALAFLGVSAFATTPASAEPTCVYAGYFALCGEYVCVDICAPEYHVDPRCGGVPADFLRQACRTVDDMYFVVG